MCKATLIAHISQQWTHVFHNIRHKTIVSVTIGLCTKKNQLAKFLIPEYVSSELFPLGRPAVLQLIFDNQYSPSLPRNMKYYKCSSILTIAITEYEIFQMLINTHYIATTEYEIVPCILTISISHEHT